MARTDYTPDQLDSIATELESAAKALRQVAALVRDSGMPSSLIHGTTTQTTYIPAIHDWIGKARSDCESQVRSYLAGTQSKAELHKQQAEQKRKSAASKKPFLKKATKTKATEL